MFPVAISFALSDAIRADDFFETHIRPVLVDTCFACHGGGKISGQLRVDSRDALLTGGESGGAVVPGKPDESLLIRAIRRHDDVSAMPPEKEKALRPDQVAAFEQWIRDGAK
ncbi:MAG: c-type cytochrome domain-containing protein, partial [bacterium]